MKHSGSIRQVMGSLLLVVVLTTCRHKNNDVMPTGDALLLDIGIPGFPAGNISIDHGQKQIRLTVPASITEVSYNATSFKTSPGSSVWRQNETAYLFNLCQNSTPAVYVLSTTNTLNIYSFVVKPAGDLRIGFVDNQTTALIGRPLFLQIDNLLDGSGGGRVILTRTGTSERDTLWALCCNGLNPCTEGYRKQLEVGIPQHVRPGEYTVEIQKDNGRRAVAKQTLTFRKGTPALESLRFMKPATVKSRNIVFRGQNLFADDSPEVVFRRVTGESFRVKPTAISPYGWDITVNLPDNLPAGYYDTQLVVRGQITDTHNRFAVLQHPEQPAVISIGNLLEPLSASPLSLQRNKGYVAQIQPQINPGEAVQVKIQIKLTPVGNPAQPVLIDFSNGAFNSDYAPTLLIPSRVSPGRYQLSVFATYSNGQVVESEPLERLIDVL